VQQVIGPRTEVEQVARPHAIRIVIVVLRAGLRKGKEFGRPGTVAGCDRVAVGSEGSVAGEADRHLLFRGQRQRSRNVRHSAHHQTAIIAPREIYPFCFVGPLVVKDGTLLVSLVIWPKVRYAWNPCKSMVLTRAVTPSSLELCQEIGNVIGVLNRMLKSYALCVYFQK